MKRKVLVALAVASIFVGLAAAKPQGVGLGLMAGEPSGLSLKVWMGGNVALDAGLGYSWWPGTGDALQVHGDILWHTRSLVQSGNGFLPLYIGLGARVKMADAPHDYPLRAGLRIPFGLEYVFSMVPLGLFFELAPTIDLTPATGNRFYGNSSIGFRYYFSGYAQD